MAAPGKTLAYADLPVENVGIFLLNRMKSFGNAVALVDGKTLKSYTYSELVQRIERTAAGLQKIGVAKDDVICIASPNHTDYVVVCYATWLVSATVQPVNPTYTKDDISRSVKNCNTKFMVTVPELLPVVKAGLAGNDAIKVIVFGKAEGCIPFENLLDPVHGGYTTPEVNPKTSIAALLSSSGTTGFPKAVKLSHFAITSDTISIISSGAIQQGDTCLLFLPLFHIYGLCVLSLCCHASGGRVIIMAKFEPDRFLKLIETYRPRMLNVVPPIMVMLAKHPRLSDYDLTSVESITCGAAPLSAEVEEVVKKRLNLKFVHQGFGMTEVGVTHLNTDKENRYKSVGKLVPLMEMKIVDVDTGKTLGKNQEGEIWVRGPHTALGYLNLPQETAEMFLPDGWVRTGDVGKEDDDGFLFIVDRIKELIKYKGYQVAPAALEDMLLRHDKVADVGVIGVPDEEAGELPKAFVVKKPGVKVTADELMQFVAAKVPPHMKLRGGVEFLDQIPRSLSGKILRRTLRQLARTTQSKL